jgi:hypothetical protein
MKSVHLDGQVEVRPTPESVAATKDRERLSGGQPSAVCQLLNRENMRHRIGLAGRG